MSLEWTPEVEDLLADGYNVQYGARSIKHEVSLWSVCAHTHACVFMYGHSEHVCL